MSFAWQTVEQAAVTLGISTRTIARRIAKGELDSRLSNGRREVYIPVPQGAQNQAKPQYSGEAIEADFTESDVQPEPSYEQTVRHTVSAASTHNGDVETSTALILAEDRARRAEMAITVYGDCPRRSAAGTGRSALGLGGGRGNGNLHDGGDRLDQWKSNARPAASGRAAGKSVARHYGETGTEPKVFR